jgi:hypothetical protein
MCQLIEEALTAAHKGGVEPTEIRLGRRQMSAYRAWATRFVPGPPTAGPSEAYDDIPVVAVDKESHRGIVGADGEELILE